VQDTDQPLRLASARISTVSRSLSGAPESPSHTIDELDPIGPSTAREPYLDHTKTHRTEATVRAHYYRTRYIVDWCDENGVDNLNDLTGRDLHEFRLWHMEHRDINQVTLRQHLCTSGSS